MICVWYWFHGKWRIARDTKRSIIELRCLIVRAGYPARVGTTDVNPASPPDDAEIKKLEQV